MEIKTNENNTIVRQQLLQQLQPRVHHAQPLVVAGQVLALFADNRAQPLLDLRVIDIIVVDPALVAGVVRLYMDSLCSHHAEIQYLYLMYSVYNVIILPFHSWKKKREPFTALFHIDFLIHLSY